MNTAGWSSLFGISPDYLGTTVCMSVNEPRVYLTMDRWASKQAFDQFLEEHRDRYDRLAALHRELYESAERIGFYDA